MVGLADFLGGSSSDALEPPVSAQVMKSRRAALAAALARSGQPQQGMTHWAQPLAQGINAAADAYQARQLAEQEARSTAAANAVFGAADRGTQALRPAAGSFGVSGPTAILAPAVRTSSADAAPSFVSAEGTQPTGKFTGGKADFVAALSPHALSVSEQTGVDPRIVIAQSALETGFGRSAPGNNFFGIKGPGNKLATNEVVDGQTVRINDSFRAYPSMADSAQGYADFINKNPRYAGVKGAQGLEAQAAALGKSGYATDPNYGAKVLSIARGLPDLRGAAPAPGKRTADASDVVPGAEGQTAMADLPAPGARPVSMEQGGNGFVVPGSDQTVPAAMAPTPPPRPQDALVAALANGPVTAPPANDAMLAALAPADAPAPNMALAQALDPSSLGQDQGTDLAASFAPQLMGPPTTFAQDLPAIDAVGAASPLPPARPAGLDAPPVVATVATPDPAQMPQAAPVLQVAAPPLPPARPVDLAAVDPRADMPAPGAIEASATLAPTAMAQPAAPAGYGLAGLPGAPMLVSNPMGGRPDLSNSTDGGARAFAADAGNRIPGGTAQPGGFVVPPGGPVTTGTLPPVAQGGAIAPAPAGAAPAALAGAPTAITPASQQQSAPAPQAQPDVAGVRSQWLRVLSDPFANDQMKGHAAKQLERIDSLTGGQTTTENGRRIYTGADGKPSVLYDTTNDIKHVDLGDSVGFVDAQGHVTRTVSKSKLPDYGEIGRDIDGNPKYGFRNYTDQTVNPTPGQNTPPVDMKGNPIPAGVNPKVVRETQSKSYADDTVPVDAKTIAGVRQEVLGLPSYKNIKQAAPTYRAMLSTAGTDTKASDLNLIYGMGKIMDPGSVVREGELALAQGTSGLDERMKGYANSVFGGARLTPETRASLLAEAHGRMKSYEDEFNVDAEHYRGIAKRGRMNVEDVVPTFEPMKAWEPAAKADKPGAPPDRSAVEQELRRRGLVK